MLKEIIITTYNRLPYLQKCLWSIIASTKPPYRIIVCDDGSTDGTKEFLQLMENRNLVEVVYRETNKGTAENFNLMIEMVEGDWFVMANDDMYFHRGWDDFSYSFIDKYKDCGILSIYNYSRVHLDSLNEEVDGGVWRVYRTGLGSSLVYKPSFIEAGKFQMAALMGYFTTPFCARFHEIENERKEIYSVKPHWVSNMDLPNTPLCERDILEDYSTHRKKWKK